jgi:DNA-binding transcriptional MocR family regulator
MAGEIARLVADGSLEPGERLPTVREIAATLGVSAGTVAAAWRALADAGTIVSRGRAGTFVRTEPREWLSPRVQVMTSPGGPRRVEPVRLDLSHGTPDPAMLPALEDAFTRVAPRADTGRYHDLPVLPELHAHISETWPAPGVETFTVVDGALDGISRTLEQVARFGDRVAVESPGFPYFFDLLEALGAEPVPLALARDGVTTGALARALARKPAAVSLQPRSQNPTGISMTPERARALAQVIMNAPDGRRVTIIKDDHSALISSAPDVTLARWIPNQVVHVRSFSKSHGPDLRIAALGGPARVVDRLVARRMLGPGWTSRLLQTVLLDLLTDPGPVARVRTARLIYRDRLDSMATALRRFGVDVGDPDGINLWVPVVDERAARMRLAASGIAVSAGSPYRAPTDDVTTPHIRVTAGALTANVRLVAEALAEAAEAPPVG